MKQERHRWIVFGSISIGLHALLLLSLRHDTTSFQVSFQKGGSIRAEIVQTSIQRPEPGMNPKKAYQEKSNSHKRHSFGAISDAETRKLENLIQTQMVYPERARMLGLEADVVVRVDVDASGHAQRFLFLSDVPAEFKEEVREHLSEAAFPKKGHPYQVRMKFIFRLD